MPVVPVKNSMSELKRNSKQHKLNLKELKTRKLKTNLDKPRQLKTN